MVFFSKIGSVVTLLLQIALVVAAVLVFSFFDPFGMFKPSAPTLEDTPVSLKSIRSIGELISAEYYGEVIVSLQGKYLEEIDTTAAAFAQKASTLNEAFIAAIAELKQQDSVRFRGFSRGRKIKEYFHATFPDLTSDPGYHAFMEALLASLGERNEQNLLKRLYQEKLDNKRLKVEATAFENFKKEELNELYADKFKRNRQLVVLGRGWVKAGFDFGEFTESNFKYDADKKVVHFIGLEPKLLSCVINPWFIPEKGVKGFEIVLASNKNDPTHILEAKTQALNKLRAQALERNILRQATENARVNLRQFFSLLLDTELNDVVFHTNEMIYNYSTIVKDDTISGGELILVDSLIIRNMYEMPLETRAFVDSLKIKTVCYLGLCDSFRKERYAHLAYRILNDETFTTKDSLLLFKTYNDLLKISRQDSLWYDLDEKSKVSEKMIRQWKCADLQRLKSQVEDNLNPGFMGAGMPDLRPCLY